MLMCCYVKNDAGDDFYWIFFSPTPEDTSRYHLPIAMEQIQSNMIILNMS